MKISKIMILTIVLLAILSFGAVSAQDDLMDDVSHADADAGHETIQLDSNSDSLSSDDSSKSIYVDTAGSDSSDGSQKSPYATINKAISETNASQKTVIYLGEGTFVGENNTDLSIGLAHNENGGSLTIIGKGIGKTIIDANYEAPIFKSISADAVVSLVNITFVHGKGNSGSAISNAGFLTIDTCQFSNCEASDYGTVYQSGNNNLTILNSKFSNNKAYNGADVYFSRENYLLTLIGNEFENSTVSSSWAYGASVDMENGISIIRNNIFKNMPISKYPILGVRYNNGKNIGNLTGNTFINCTHDGEYGILFIQNSYIKNNRFIDCAADNGLIYINTNFNAHVKFSDVNADGTQFVLTANVTDDMGNTARYARVYFCINGKQYGYATTTNGIATLTVKGLFDNGEYAIDGFTSSDGSANPFENTVEPGKLTVNFDHNPMDLWISPDGNDESGNGSVANPFKTIKHALDYGLDKSVDVTVHLLNGVYNETGDYDLSYSQVAKISLVGESKEGTVISGNNKNVFLTSDQYTQVLLKNLTIKDLAGTNSFKVRYATFENCIVNNVKRLYAQNSPSQVVFRNVRWTNSEQLMIYNGEIYDSHFENFTSAGTGNIWLATVSSDDEIIVENSKFINMTCTGYSGGGVFYVQGNFRSINNTYENNKATRDDGGVMSVSGRSIVSINDTFKNNHAEGDYGVARFYSTSNNGDPTLIIKDAKFINNTATGNGGAIALYGGQLINCLFEDNVAGANGGAIYNPTHSKDVTLYELTLTDVTFKNNNATNGKDIFIAPSTSTSSFITVLPDMTVTFNDLTTKELYDTVSADVTHKSGAVIGGGKITFYLGDSRIGESDLVNGRAEFSYLGFKDGNYVLSGIWNNAVDDTKMINGTVKVSLNNLEDNVTLYVSDAKGNDSTADGSLDKPFKTIDAALAFGYTKSQVIYINVLEGTYAGAGNTNITTFSSLDISIIGQGKNKTIIDGENKNWFMKLLTGMGGSIKLYNMTLVNMSTNYMPSRAIGTSAIITESGTELLVDGVEFIACHGNSGGAILSQGKLTVLNSYFFNNGDSNYGGAINSEGTLYVDNSIFIGNHAKWGSTIYSAGELFFYNSIVQDSLRVNGMSGDSVAVGAKGNVTIVNSTIFRSGKTCQEIIGTGQTWANNPYFVVGVAGERLIIINSTIDGYSKSYNSQYANSGAITPTIGWNTAYKSPEFLRVYNTKFYNVYSVIAGVNGDQVFDGCVFENMTNFATTSRITSSGNLEVKNSYIIDDTFKVTKTADSNITFNNNWWGDNSQPTYTVGSTVTHPDTWLILTVNTTEEGNAIIAFKSFDGENVTDYDGAAYPREFAVDGVNVTLKVNKGTISNNVVIPLQTSSDNIFINASVDNQQVNLTRIVANISATTSPVYVGQVLVVEVTSPDYLKNNVTVVVDGKRFTAPITGTKTIVNVTGLAAGNYTAKVCYFDEVYLVQAVDLDVKIIGIVINASDVEKFVNGPEKLDVTVVDSDGKILANQTVTATIAGKTLNATTDANGKVSFDLNLPVGKYDVVVSLNTTNVTVKVTVKEIPAPVKDKIVLKAKKTIKIKKSAKKLVLKASLKINGKKAKGKVVKFKFNKKTYKAKTNKKGVAKLTLKKKVIKKLKKGKKYAAKITYGGKSAKTIVKVKK
ncbi:hypothetical protein [Methanobrevibacter sp.]|uniref:hypothetical protein n=1 Tax=Methanobrevibacter sp. TaxID=66852 RepID=UPI003867A45B